MLIGVCSCSLVLGHIKRGKVGEKQAAEECKTRQKNERNGELGRHVLMNGFQGSSFAQ